MKWKVKFAMKGKALPTAPIALHIQKLDNGASDGSGYRLTPKQQGFEKLRKKVSAGY